MSINLLLVDYFIKSNIFNLQSAVERDEVSFFDKFSEVLVKKIVSEW